METKQLDEKFTQTELSTLKDDLTKVEQDSKMKDDRIQQLEQSMQILQQNLDAVSRVLSLKPTAREIEAALRRKAENNGSTRLPRHHEYVARLAEKKSEASGRS